MPAATTQQPEPDVPASRVHALLAAVQKGDVIRLWAGSAQWHVSLVLTRLRTSGLIWPCGGAKEPG